MAGRLAPTRGNLVKLKKSIAQAQSGHDLLEQKRQVLMMELVRHIEEAKTLQGDIAVVFGDAYAALQRANVSLGIDEVEDIAHSVPMLSGIVVRLRSVMGVEIPDIDEIDHSIKPSYSFSGSTGSMDEAYHAFRNVLIALLKLAEVETCVYRLAIQIRKTHRRVNALEKVVIPKSREELVFIQSVLEEGEREDFVRMKIAKANRQKKQSAQSEEKRNAV
ncbi:MAG: V-type ATP synthase subunit D [Synergistaceae bacterium]|jgi:V/A-type H+-transporting ATPase subunit D|nr:V-type ATP synthase subunit D [Synergistaceae bacterium]